VPTPPKQKPDEPSSPPEAADTWEADQAKREYYYDDAHGYEKYDPDADDDAEPKEKDE
jgi:hypothetical protein